ncbi:MAG: hypothetical protein FWD26_06145 [Treponema sp.]|nr:hypothetical protein [Treponema sp.]
MRKPGVIILILLLGFPVLLAADDPQIEPEWDDYSYDIYVRGDQFFSISLGTIFPTIFVNEGELLDMNFSPPVGGMGTLMYNYFLSSKFFAGGEISGAFINTLRKNSLFLVTLGIRTGVQFVAGRFEFPITLSLGMCWHTYLDFGYYGFYLKGGVGAFFRITSEWSFGLTADWGWYPQWTENKSRNVDGNFVNVMLSARYHF